jgi:hypothetical protein
MKKKDFFIGMLVVLAFMFLFTSCATRLGDFTLLATRNIEYSRMGEFNIGVDRVSGKDGLFFILGIKFKPSIDLEVAIENAIDKIPGCIALADVTLTVRNMNFLLWQTHTYIVTGNAIIDPKRLSESGNDSNSSSHISLYTEDGENYETRSLTEEEYNRYLLAMKK